MATKMQLLWVFPPLFLALVGLAIYEHVFASTLSLPVSPAITVLTIILPVLAALNATAYLHLWTSANSKVSRKILAISLQAVQAIVTTVLATLFASDIFPSAARDCLLSTSWQKLFSAHDVDAIRQIQDSLECCGFNSVRDRPWPFPNHHGANACTETYGRTTPCIGPWSLALQRHAGLELGILLAIGVFQVVGLFLVSGRTWSSSSGYPTSRSPGLLAGIEGQSGRLLPRAGPIEYRDDPEEETIGPESESRVQEQTQSGANRQSSSVNPWSSE
ncbi:hypothetical protein S7711_04654 [Stachybotrys chartarum IBT 7711]|uniref:Tetraspanin Tsp3 n=1 Tax=Stachybotrys chartarum (strain CBS 109288 / IBT 7711) TaxID=1280523 RepID=A0A084B604_STACB|nr:hypothetical protein S7711_04654 [Stachybotrys chartarum IBT 7711]KFA55698.1 hypothetical protein S40293_05286 [Stachybotrys chartarum IBT 40293]